MEVARLQERLADLQAKEAIFPRALEIHRVSQARRPQEQLVHRELEAQTQESPQNRLSTSLSILLAMVLQLEPLVLEGKAVIFLELKTRLLRQD